MGKYVCTSYSYFRLAFILDEMVILGNVVGHLNGLYYIVL